MTSRPLTDSVNYSELLGQEGSRVLGDARLSESEAERETEVTCSTRDLSGKASRSFGQLISSRTAVWQHETARRTAPSD